MAVCEYCVNKNGLVDGIVDCKHNDNGKISVPKFCNGLSLNRKGWKVAMDEAISKGDVRRAKMIKKIGRL